MSWNKWYNPIKKKKLDMKKEGIAKKFNGKCFICNKTEHLVKDCRDLNQLRNPKKRLPKPKSPGLITSLMKFQK
jgi:hypothetical protein